MLVLTRTSEQSDDDSQVMRDAYQAIGRAVRFSGVGETIPHFRNSTVGLFGQQAIHDTLHNTSVCRRLCPGFLLDGISVPCDMLPRAQLCDTHDIQRTPF